MSISYQWTGCERVTSQFMSLVLKSTRRVIWLLLALRLSLSTKVYLVSVDESCFVCKHLQRRCELKLTNWKGGVICSISCFGQKLSESKRRNSRRKKVILSFYILWQPISAEILAIL